MIGAESFPDHRLHRPPLQSAESERGHSDAPSSVSRPRERTEARVHPASPFTARLKYDRKVQSPEAGRRLGRRGETSLHRQISLSLSSFHLSPTPRSASRVSRASRKVTIRVTLVRKVPAQVHPSVREPRHLSISVFREVEPGRSCPHRSPPSKAALDESAVSDFLYPFRSMTCTNIDLVPTRRPYRLSPRTPRPRRKVGTRVEHPHHFPSTSRVRVSRAPARERSRLTHQ